MTLRILNRDLIRRNMIEKIRIILEYQQVRDAISRQYAMKSKDNASINMAKISTFMNN